jgi:hypothetical protein
MPLFIDVHETVDGVTAEAVAQAHHHELQAHPQRGVKNLTYWVDEGSGKVIGLIEAVSQEAAEAVHRDDHDGVALVQIRPRPLD